jgi:riboflavin synthase
LVLGHVDDCARVVAVRAVERTHVLEVEVPESLRDYVVPKGCIALDGVSLTVGPAVHGGRFEVYLIPHTWEQTTLGERRPGDRVHVEVDVVGRYVVHRLRSEAAAWSARAAAREENP